MPCGSMPLLAFMTARHAQVHGPVLRSCGLAGLVSYVDGQSTTFATEGPFSPDTAHDEFGRQTSKCLFDMPREDGASPFGVGTLEPMTPTRLRVEEELVDGNNSDEDIGVI